jgi:2-phosphoglycerate kinase
VTEKRRSGALLGGEEGLPYSKGLMARALIAAGVSALPAYELAQRIELDLAGGGDAAATFDRLDELATEVLGDAAGRRAVRRLRLYRRLQELDVPLILLIGGATGTGKSTVATEVAWRLGITRVTSTDFVRQTMRAFFSDEFMPSIHYSSFEAGQALRAPDEAVDAAVAGFLEQTRNVLVGVRAALERALQEGWSMVLEGVHLVPGLIPPAIEDAIVVQCVLAIGDEDEHRTHFHVRDADSDGARAADKYIRGFPEIRRIQDAIVARAERAGVPVVENESAEEAVGSVMELVLERAEELEAKP